MSIKLLEIVHKAKDFVARTGLQLGNRWLEKQQDRQKCAILFEEEQQKYFAAGSGKKEETYSKCLQLPGFCF